MESIREKLILHRTFLDSSPKVTDTVTSRKMLLVHVRVKQPWKIQSPQLVSLAGNVKVGFKWWESQGWRQPLEKRGYDISICCPSVHFLSGKASEYCDSAQRWHIAIAIVFSMRGKCWWGTVPTFFFYSAVTCLWRKLNFQKVWVFVLFATDEDKPLQTLYSEALTAWFNLNPILLILIVAPAYRAQGNEKMSFSCSSFRPSPESHGHTYFKFKDKIIRGCFVEGTLYLNRIKELCRDKVALWDVGSMFRVVYLVDFTASTFHTDVN